jgi:hypothetical protein
MKNYKNLELNLPNTISSNGKTFSKRDSSDEQTTYYEYRGSVVRDEEGDEFVDSNTWEAVLSLVEKLEKQGYKVERCYDEKGWVCVIVEQYLNVTK